MGVRPDGNGKDLARGHLGVEEVDGSDHVLPPGAVVEADGHSPAQAAPLDDDQQDGALVLVEPVGREGVVRSTARGPPHQESKMCARQGPSWATRLGDGILSTMASSTCGTPSPDLAEMRSTSSGLKSKRVFS
jgi:hypothetical protein